MTEFVEKRRYFRVEDRLEIAYRVLQAGERTERSVSMQRDQAQSFAQLENQIQMVYQKVANKAPDIAELCRLLHRKINLLHNDAGDTDSGANDHPLSRSVNISACGIAFAVAEPVPLGSQLLLRTRLQPADHEVAVIAYVIACEAVAGHNSSDWYTLRADFTDISDELQELMIQHVMQAQARYLRQRRQAQS